MSRTASASLDQQLNRAKSCARGNEKNDPSSSCPSSAPSVDIRPKSLMVLFISRGRPRRSQGCRRRHHRVRHPNCKYSRFP